MYQSLQHRHYSFPRELGMDPQYFYLFSISYTSNMRYMELEVPTQRCTSKSAQTFTIDHQLYQQYQDGAPHE